MHTRTRRSDIPRYVIERHFTDGLIVPIDGGGDEVMLGVVERNAEHGVTWVHSYVSDDKQRSYCMSSFPAMRLSAAVVVAGGALVAAAAAASAEEAPVPTRDCSGRTEPTRGHLRFAAADDVVIGPVSFASLGLASSRRAGTPRPDGTILVKAGAKVLWGPPVRVSVVAADRARLSLEYTREPSPVVRFVGCPPGMRMHNGLRYLRVTGFSGGFSLRKRGCYTLEVQAEGRRAHRRTVSLGGGTCE